MTKRRARKADQQAIEALSPKLFKALGDPNRIALLARLASCGQTTVTEAAACCPVDLSVVSRHLAVLRDAGVVASTRQGKEVRYTLRAGVLVQTLRALADAIESCCGTQNCCDIGVDRAGKKGKEEEP